VLNFARWPVHTQMLALMTFFFLTNVLPTNRTAFHLDTAVFEFLLVWIGRA
jgi:hypothetical protein